MKKISIIISDFLRENGMTKASLAKKLNESPQNLNKKLSKNELTSDYIFNISVALNHNFFKDLSSEFETYLKGPEHYLNMMANEMQPEGSATKEEAKAYFEDLIKSQVEKVIKEMHSDNTLDKNERRRYIKTLEANSELLGKIDALEKKKNLAAGHDIPKLKER
jgi:polyhydroxyalkanoate synthesis regulator phasin